MVKQVRHQANGRWNPATWLGWFSHPLRRLEAGTLGWTEPGPLGLATPASGWPLVPLWGQSLAGFPERGAGKDRRRRLGGGRGAGGHTAVLASHRWLLWLHPLDWVGSLCRQAARVPALLASGLRSGGADPGGALVRWLGALAGAKRRWSNGCADAAILGAGRSLVIAQPTLFWNRPGTSPPCSGDPALAGLEALGWGRLGWHAAPQLLIRLALLAGPWMATAAAKSGAKVGRRRSGNRAGGLALPTLTAALHLLGWSQAAPRSSRAGGSSRFSCCSRRVPTREEVRTGAGNETPA